MTHRPTACAHNYSAWTTEESINEANERCFVFEHRCYECGHIERESGGIIEPQDLRYTRVLTEKDYNADD